MHFINKTDQTQPEILSKEARRSFLLLLWKVFSCFFKNKCTSSKKQTLSSWNPLKRKHFHQNLCKMIIFIQGGGWGPSQGLVVSRICRAYVVERFSREGPGNDEPIRAAIDSWNKKTTKSTLSRWDARSFFKSQVTFECRISTFSRRYPLDPLKTWRKCQDETLKIRKEEKRGGLA